MKKTEKRIPIQFKTLDCPKCGATDSIRFIDRSNITLKTTTCVSGVYQARCLHCGYAYIANWSNDEYLLEDKKHVIDSFAKEFSNNKKRNIDKIVFDEFDLCT